MIGGHEKYRAICRHCYQVHRHTPGASQPATGSKLACQTMHQVLQSIKQETLDSSDEDFLCKAVAKATDELNNEPSTSAAKRNRTASPDPAVKKELPASPKVATAKKEPPASQEATNTKNPAEKKPPYVNPAETEKVFEDNPMDEDLVHLMIESENIALGFEKHQNPC